MPRAAALPFQDELQAAAPASGWWFMHVNTATTVAIQPDGHSAMLTQGTDRLWLTNLTGVGSFLMMGVIGLVVASLVSIFLKSPALMFAINVLGVFIFAGLIAYDTQRLKMTYYELGGDGTSMAVATNFGALSLYINFINLFQFLLSFMGGNRD